MKLRLRAKLFIRKLNGNKRHLPDFIVIGVQKGGTTFLYHTLKQHDQIEMAIRKEVHFFDKFYSKGMSWYRAHFSVKKNNSKKIVGENTPGYIFKENVLDRVHKHLPNARFIVLLRNPVDRAFSHYHMLMRRHPESGLTFEKYIDIASRKSYYELKEYNIQKKFLNVLERGLYAHQLEQWFSVYPRDRFYITESETLFNNPVEELMRIHEFLGVTPVPPKDLRPRNTGGYSSDIPDGPKNFLYEYYKNDIKKLAKMGINYEWTRL